MRILNKLVIKLMDLGIKRLCRENGRQVYTIPANRGKWYFG
jgi:hypothetical protein